MPRSRDHGRPGQRGDPTGEGGRPRAAPRRGGRSRGDGRREDPRRQPRHAETAAAGGCRDPGDCRRADDHEEHPRGPALCHGAHDGRRRDEQTLDGPRADLELIGQVLRDSREFRMLLASPVDRRRRRRWQSSASCSARTSAAGTLRLPPPADRQETAKRCSPTSSSSSGSCAMSSWGSSPST